MDGMTGNLLKRPGEGRPSPWSGTRCGFLAVGGDNNGRYALWEAVVPPGGGPPPHIRSSEAEGFHTQPGHTPEFGGDIHVATQLVSVYFFGEKMN